MPDTILVADCGAQYGHLIARGIRRLHVYSELVPWEKLHEKIHSAKPKGIIISGGPDSVYESNSPDPRAALEAGVPVLGICFGHQYIAHATGGRVEAGEKKEYGPAKVRVFRRAALTSGLEDSEDVWMSHGDLVTSLPDGFNVYAESGNCPIAAYGNDRLKLYGLQFHPEVVHTPKGEVILRNFVRDICNASPNWTMEDYTEKAIEAIREKAGNEKVLLALSGGVDSSACAALGQRAIGKNLVALYVDNGLMRLGETGEIADAFSRVFPVDLDVINAAEQFYAALKGVEDPERKRNIVGDLFAQIFEAKMGSAGAKYLMQGTIYPDWIESAYASKDASVIKTPHNVGSPLIAGFRRGGRIIEPLIDLYKDEVREVAANVGLPDSIVFRQPFPGPGMAVRIFGSVTEKKADLLRRADAIVREEIDRSGSKPWQYFAVLTGSKATGVRGDKRAYGEVIAIRAVESREAMTASVSRLDYDVLEKIASRIPNEIPEVTRVLYDITSKPPATIEWE